jgi:hypothetical protein
MRLAAKFLDANATSNLQFSAARMQAVILSLGCTRQCHRWTGRYDLYLHVHQRGSCCGNSSYPTPYYSAWYHDNGAARIYVVSEFYRTERLLGAESIRRDGSRPDWSVRPLSELGFLWGGFRLVVRRRRGGWRQLREVVVELVDVRAARVGDRLAPAPHTRG